MPIPRKLSAAKAAKHNRAAGPIVQMIAAVCTSDNNVLDAAEMMVLCESVVMGVFMFAVATGSDKTVLKEMFSAIEERLAESRLGDVQTQGTG